MLLWDIRSLLRKLLETNKQWVGKVVWPTGRGVHGYKGQQPLGQTSLRQHPVLVASVCELPSLFTLRCHTKVIFYSLSWRNKVQEALFYTMVLSIGSMRGLRIHSRHSQGPLKWVFQTNGTLEVASCPTFWVHAYFSQWLIGGLGLSSDRELTSS